MKNNLIYAYCITKNPARFSMKGIDNQKIHKIAYQNLVAIVNYVKYEDFNKKALIANLKNPKWAEGKIRAHAEVTQKVMEKQTVLPLKFGTIFKNDEGVRKSLKANKTKFLHLLNKFEGKEEWGVKIYAGNQKFGQYLKKTDKELKKIQGQAQRSSGGWAYLLEKKGKKELGEKVAETAKKCVAGIFEVLSQESKASRLNKNLSPKLSGKATEMILNSVFLVDKRHFNKFRQSLNKMLEKYKHFGLEVELSGPWPAYNFL